MLIRRLAIFVPLLSATFVVGAVSSTAASPDAPTPDEVCALLTTAEATKLMGKPAKATPGAPSPDSATCMWSAGGREGLQVMIETDGLFKAAGKSDTVARRFKDMEDLIKKGQAKAVPGLGDKALWYTGSNLLWVLKGNKVAVVSVLKQISPADDLPGARALAAKVVAKL